MTRTIKTISIRQKGVKRLQRRLAQHRDELGVHASHLNDLLAEVQATIQACETATIDLTRAINRLERK